MHDCVSAECGQASPPAVGATVARVRLMEPPPQDLVHVDQADQAGTTQSVGHACVLHTRSSFGGQCLPLPRWATRIEATLRLCVPVAVALLHERVQVDQAVQTWTQSTSHGWVLQLRVASSAAGHLLPPLAASTDTERVRDWTPPSHASEQLFHVDH